MPAGSADRGKVGRGELRIYLGAAPGVGKTYAMLGEAHRRAERGTDVVVGLVETHGRAKTSALLDGLDSIPRQELVYRGSEFTELDIDALLERHPEVAVVDELAHTNIPGSRNEKRWQDIDELLDAGIDVLSTVNIQHLESLNDVIERITGAHKHETVPDEVVRRAEQLELVDITPEALRRRLAHGNVYPAHRIDASGSWSPSPAERRARPSSAGAAGSPPPLPAGLPRATAPQARTPTVAAPLSHHRSRHGLPVRELAQVGVPSCGQRSRIRGKDHRL